MYRARAARAGPEPGSPGRFGILSTGQLRDLLQDEPKLDRIVRLSRKEQMEQLLLGEQSLEAFLPAFQRGRALAHLRRTQAEKLQELLRRRERERSAQPAPSAAADPPKPFPAAAVLPTGAARGPPAVPRSLPPLDSRPVPPLKGSPGCPLGPAPLLSPRPSQPEPPHR
uniref:VPS37D subunit of ESCRT-I n=1 Tax=Molossus molossus TaxID=27622 RepID=A0A7J8J482_MOLMO|nr:VPS37D subunit of ESCRT-I [Molossus molossus]